MADHLRMQIRGAVVTALRGLDETHERVFAMRRIPLKAEDLPALCVYTAAEESAVMNMGPVRHTQRGLDLIVQAVAQDNERLEDLLDAICRDVETALATDRTLGGLAYDVVLSRTQISMDPASRPEFKTASATMTFRVSYRAKELDPSTIN